MIDLLLVGGGLASALLAWRLREARPELDVRVLEREPRLGGDHTWSFHGSDLSPGQLAWLQPLVAHSWDGYDVRFPAHERRLGGSYHSLTSERLRGELRRALGPRLRLGCPVREIAPRAVVLADGSRLEAGVVVDGRGLDAARLPACGWQKFLGQHLRLEAPHGLQRPVLMDATVEQRDGFRFFYLLPWGPSSLLIEDTRYADTPDLDPEEWRREIARYAQRRGWRVAAVEREERGALPIPLAGAAADWAGDAVRDVPRAGLRAGLFHMTTGYSLPEAAALADAVAALPRLDPPSLLALQRARTAEAWRRGGFFRFLNRMLFRAAAPERRFLVLERFYRLPEPLIRRFYAGRLTALDCVRLLSGRPPVPLLRAASCLLPHRAA